MSLSTLGYPLNFWPHHTPAGICQKSQIVKSIGRKMKNFKQLPTKGFICNFSWTWRQIFYIDLTKTKTSRRIKYWPSIDPFFPKNWNFGPKDKIPKNLWEKLNRFHYCKIAKFWFFKSALLLWDRFLPIFYKSGRFFWPNQYKKPVFMFMRNYKEILPWEVA